MSRSHLRQPRRAHHKITLREDPTPTPADVDLTPLTIGFDLRRYNVIVDLPLDTKSVRYTVDGRTWRAEGNPRDLARILRKAGFRLMLLDRKPTS